MHIGSFEKMVAFKDEFLTPLIHKPLKILEMGAQDINGTYRSIFDEYPWEYQGSDMVAGRNVDIVLKNPYKWDEIASDYYDVVISGSLLEHVEYPWITMIEIERILKPGGLTCHIAPAAGFEHRFPVDCYRYYPDGFNALLKWANLEPLKVYTDWNTESSPDGGHVWKDSVMIAKKKLDGTDRAEIMETLLFWMNKAIQ